jgi:NDP-sugar pyrophosphorylase family protein
MGGIGARFAAVGYEKPKPFIRINGKAIIEHVVAMYPGAHEFIFVVNEHFIGNEVLSSLEKKLPNSRIIPIPEHKEGPVRSLSFMWDELPEDEPVLVSYCDFNATWDFADFLKKVEDKTIDGAIPSYTGFHPHLLHKKKYAGILADKNGRINQIREKYSFTENTEDSYHSAGNYYFSKAGEVRNYGEALIESGNTLNGEFYISMLYYQYLADGKNILVYPLTHFLQWGTPEDLEEYEAWSLLLNGNKKGVTDTPESRKPNLKIPYPEDSQEYIKSFNYWKDYFSK